MSLKIVFTLFIFHFVIFSKGQELKLMLPAGHTASVNAVQFSNDGRFACTASDDFSAKIWEVNSGRLIHSLNGHTRDVDVVSFNANDTRIITGSKDGTAGVWDILTGKLLFMLNHSKPVTMVKFSADGKYIITCATWDLKATVWDAVTGRELFIMESRLDSLARTGFIKYSNDGKLIGKFDLVRFAGFDDMRKAAVTVSSEGEVKKWMLSTGALLTQWKIPAGNANVYGISNSGEFVVANVGQNAINIFSVQDSGYTRLPSSGKEVKAASFSPNDSLLALGIDDGSIELWNWRKKKLLKVFMEHSKEITVLRFGSDSVLLSAARDGQVICRTISGSIIFKKQGSDAVISNDDKFVMMASGDRALIFTIRYPDRLVTLQTAAESIHSFSVLPNSGKTIVNYKNKPTVLFNLVDGVIKVLPVTSNGEVEKIIASNASETRFLCMEKDKLIIRRTDNQQIEFTFEKVKNAVFSNNGKLLAVIGVDGISLFETIHYKLLKQISAKDVQGTFRFSPNDQLIVFNGNGHIVIYDIASGKITGEIETQSMGIELSPDSKLLFSKKIFDRTGYLYKLPGGEPYKLLEAHNDWINSASFSKDGTKLLTTSADKTIIVWNIKDAGPRLVLKGHTASVNNASFSKDGKKIISAASDFTSKVWDATTGKFLYTLEGHNGAVLKADFNTNDQWITTVSDDGSFGVWEPAADGDVVFYFNMFGEIVKYNKQNYYAGNRKALDKFYFKKGLQTIRVDHFDLQFNRPDLLLRNQQSIIKRSDSILLSAYRKVYLKRLRKYKIDTASFTRGIAVPSAEILNSGNLAFEQESSKLQLHIAAKDSVGYFDKLNIWVNEVPVYGSKGLILQSRRLSFVDTVITIDLSEGDNKIEMSVTNNHQAESYRVPFVVRYLPAKPPQAKMRFIGIGIDRFADSQYNLQWSVKDIRDLAIKLREKYKDNITIDTLFNENVTVNNVRQLKRTLTSSTVHDKVLLAYSGHGLLNKSYDYFLSTFNINFNQPEENGLPYEELESILDSIPARKKLLLIDACHSGEVDKEDGIAMNKAADSLGLIKGIIIKTKHPPQVGLQNSFELMQNLFVNIGSNTGATIISAAGGNQFALERNDLKNGVFTYSILEAMNDYPSMKVSGLKKIVGEKVLQLTNGMQRPTSRNEAAAIDWELW